MDPRRVDLQNLLEAALGTANVYFQPPENNEIQYPCIVYHREFTETEFADDRPYHHNLRYQVTVIDRNPDSDIPRKIRDLPKCRHVRFFTAHDLNHDVFTLVF